MKFFQGVGFVLFLTAVVVAAACLLSGCVKDTKSYADKVMASNKDVVSRYVRVDEHTLTDGTRCAVATSGSTNGGASITCDWHGPITLESPNHNKLGGYIPACGDLPGLVGDDC